MMKSLKVLTLAVNDQSQAKCKSPKIVWGGGTMGGPYHSPGGLDGAWAAGVEEKGGVEWGVGVEGGGLRAVKEKTLFLPGALAWRSGGGARRRRNQGWRSPWVRSRAWVTCSLQSWGTQPDGQLRSPERELGAALSAHGIGITCKSLQWGVQ